MAIHQAEALTLYQTQKEKKSRSQRNAMELMITLLIDNQGMHLLGEHNCFTEACHELF